MQMRGVLRKLLSGIAAKGIRERDVTLEMVLQRVNQELLNPGKLNVVFERPVPEDFEEVRRCAKELVRDP